MRYQFVTMLYPLIPLIVIFILIYFRTRKSERKLDQISENGQRELERISKEAASAHICRTEIIGAQAAVIAIHNHLFSRAAKTFADVATSSTEDMSTWLRHLDTRTLILALLDVPQYQQDLILKHISSRAREALCEEMQSCRNRGITES